MAKNKEKDSVKEPKTKIKCTKCERTLSTINFYSSKSPMFPTKKIPICKECIKDMIDYDDIDTVYSILRLMDLPFIQEIWRECEINKNDTFGCYLRRISLPSFKGLKWKNSIFSGNEVTFEDGIIKNKPLLSLKEKQRLIDKWGLGYDDNELYSFEKKYVMLKDNYPEKTAMHTEALFTYIRYRVKEELATAQGDAVNATKWGSLADKAAQNAKINPSQLSNADLSGGLNGFGELVRAVEGAKDIIPILPKFKKKASDDVDFTLLCYINYVRRLKNLPDATYEEVWDFYEKRRQEYGVSKEDMNYRSESDDDE